MTITKTEHQNMKEIKAELLKALKYEENYEIKVKIYDCFEDGQYSDGQTYDVEINYYFNGEYEDGFLNQTFQSEIEGDEQALKQAMKRAKQVLKTVQGWFEYDEDATVDKEIEVYHV